VIECVPLLRLDVVKLAPPETSVIDPSVVVPSRKVTVPVILPASLRLLFTVGRISLREGDGLAKGGRVHRAIEMSRGPSRVEEHRHTVTVYHCQIRCSIAVEVPHRYSVPRDRPAVVVDRCLEGAIAVALQYAKAQTVTARGSCGQVQLAVVVEVRDGHGPGVAVPGVADHRLERAVPVAQEDAHSSEEKVAVKAGER